MDISVTFWQAIIGVITPLLVLLIPGLFVVQGKSIKNILNTGVRVFVISMSVWTLGTLLVTTVGFPLSLFYTLVLIASAVFVWKRSRQFFTIATLWYALAIAVPVLLAYAIFTIPFLHIHEGLPTGDSQKAIFWAQDIIDNNALPEYSRANKALNRDPVDFYTPGLHALIAGVMNVSPIPLVSVGLFSIVVAVAVAFIAAAMIKELFDDHPHVVPPLLAALFVLTNFRFLRYLREPGYHLQNLVGEFFLFALIYYGLRFIKKKNTADVIMGLLSVISLVFVHQFSSFVAAFAVAALIVAAIIKDRRHIAKYLWQHAVAGAAACIVLLFIVVAGFAIGLQEKIPHIFTTTPHLLSLVRPVTDYPLTMGAVWFLSAIAGLMLIVLQAKKHQAHFEASRAFFAVTLVILALSQGPRFFIDIPPVRALLYSVVPLSVAAAYFFTKVLHVIKNYRYPFTRYAALLLWVSALVLPMWSSVSKAYATNHVVRTNSTLTAQQLALADIIRSQAISPDQAVLIDDYNRRSASWLVLSGQPMYTRIAADIRRQMDEARQSTERQKLYLTLLDYEKIFSLGSKQELVHLLRKHNVTWLTGIEKSSASAFNQNPALQPVAYGGDISLYTPLGGEACAVDSTCAWLLRSSTLVNDIGDDQDTFEHLPASLRTSRLSDAQTVDGVTFRTTTAPYIPLRFNVGDFTAVLWDREGTGRPDTAVEFLINFAIKPTRQLEVITSTGAVYPVVGGEPVRIRPEDLLFEEDGFISLQLKNEASQLVAIDLIALGLSHIP